MPGLSGSMVAARSGICSANSWDPAAGSMLNIIESGGKVTIIRRVSPGCVGTYEVASETTSVPSVGALGIADVDHSSAADCPGILLNARLRRVPPSDMTLDF